MLAHPLTHWSVNQFVNDWESVYAHPQTTLKRIIVKLLGGYNNGKNR